MSGPDLFWLTAKQGYDQFLNDIQGEWLRIKARICFIKPKTG
jgi:hypothetical protein